LDAGVAGSPLFLSVRVVALAASAETEQTRDNLPQPIREQAGVGGCRLNPAVTEEAEVPSWNTFHPEHDLLR
jgi:hypothetical protein